MNELLSHLDPAVVSHMAIDVGLKLIGSVALWIIGGIAINVIGAISGRAMTARKVDPTLIKYLESTLHVILRVVLVIAILSVFGIETTSFAALLAAAGLAVGAAWSGLLSNFAAGAFLVVLRPFKVGDMITVGGVTGDVMEIGMFFTTLMTIDYLRIFVGNSKVLGDNVINYSSNPFRRVDLKAQIDNSVDPLDAIARLSVRVAQIANVMATPAPSVEILEFNPAGTLIAVRPFCDNVHYWQVFFDTNKAIQEVCASAGYPVPAPHQVMLQKQA